MGEEMMASYKNKHPSLTPRKLQLHCTEQKIDEGDVDSARAISQKLADKGRIEQL